MKRKLMTMMAAASLAVGPAAANHADQDPHCKQTGGTNACLRVTPMGADIYRVHVGIDVTMGPEDVEAALTHGGVLSASIWGDDGSDSEDDRLIAKEEVRKLFEEPGPNGYGGEFEVLASGDTLNEDTSTFGSRRDEIVGKIEVFFPNTGQTVTYETGVVAHHF